MTDHGFKSPSSAPYLSDRAAGNSPTPQPEQPDIVEWLRGWPGSSERRVRANAAADEIERLRSPQKFDADAIADLAAEITKLREALRPFVEAQGYWGDGLSDDTSAGWHDYPDAENRLPLTVGDMRRARTALGEE